MSDDPGPLAPDALSRRWGLAAVAASLPLTAWLIWDFVTRRPQAPLTDPSTPEAITTVYVLEALVLNLVVLASLSMELRRGRPIFGLLWSALGALTALAALGSWSIGYALAPGLVIGAAAGWLASARCGARPAHAGTMFLLGLGGQIVLMLAIIIWMTRRVSS